MGVVRKGGGQQRRSRQDIHSLERRECRVAHKRLSDDSRTPISEIVAREAARKKNLRQRAWVRREVDSRTLPTAPSP